MADVRLLSIATEGYAGSASTTCNEVCGYTRRVRWFRNYGKKKDISSFCYGSKPSETSHDKRRTYNEASKAEALLLASENRSIQAAAQQLGISPKLLYRW